MANKISSIDRFCIVVVTYNRSASLQRLLGSLLRARYHDAAVDLIISIDHGAEQPHIEEIAGRFVWPFGEKTIRTFEKNLGLRQHIIKCGSITDEYDAVIILEDDLVVGRDFFKFASSALKTYASEPSIAGISLYAPAFNEMAELPFDPTPSDYDTYFLRSAQSWGQCWTKDMWQGFLSWYLENKTELKPVTDMPARIYSWPESSWKKYFMKYLAVTGKTWVYPYVSHSTNCSEIGTHNQAASALFQTVLSDDRDVFVHPEISSGISYDIFFEREGFFVDLPNGSRSEVLLDLYGTKSSVKAASYLVSTRVLNKGRLASYRLSLKPHEANLTLENNGSDVHLYDLEGLSSIDLFTYPKVQRYAYYSNLGWYGSLIAGLHGLRHAIKRRLTVKAIWKKLNTLLGRR